MSELLKTALHLCKDSGLRIWGVTADGHPSNISAFKKLGCSFDTLDNMVNSFKHPDPDCDDDVYVLPDACHMLKLARNALAEYQHFKCGDEVIDWNYINLLHVYQTKLGFKFANKLSKTHVLYQNNRMKVKLAAQTFSSSVADALELLKDSGKPQFQNCEATIKFIRNIDRLFDFLNSRNPVTKSGFKKPIYYDRIPRLEKSMMQILKYLYSLTDLKGEPLYRSPRKTFILGFAALVKSTLAISKELLSTKADVFKYLLTYSFSQDHLELFFSRIRRRFGNNDNPNVGQFKTAMKQLILKNSIAASASANCVAFEDDVSGDIFEIKWSRKKVREFFQDEYEIDIEDIDEEAEKLEEDTLFNAVETLDSRDVDEVHEDFILYYIAGFVVKNLKSRNKLKCDVCASRLIKSLSEHEHDYICISNTSIEKFVRLKNRGGLKWPSISVFKIIKATEQELKRITSNFDNVFIKNLFMKIIHSVTKRMYNIFNDMNICESEEIGGPSHRIHLLKMVSATYLKIRLFAYAKFRKDQGEVSKRHKFTKLTIFSHE